MYNAAYELRSDRQRNSVKALVAQIGSVDWQMEGYNSAVGQQDLSINFHWGTTTASPKRFDVPCRMGNRHLMLSAEFFEGVELPPNHFRGRK